MSYTPVNVNMYIASFAGALSGMNASGRVPSNAVAATYIQFAAIAGAWAQSFDTTWNDAEPANTLQLQLAQQLSADMWSNRAPQPASATTLDPAYYDMATAALVAMIQASDTYIASEGIVVPGTGQGGNVVTTLVDYQMLTSDVLVQVDCTNEQYITITLPENAVEGSRYSVAATTMPLVEDSASEITIQAPVGGSIIGAYSLSASGCGITYIKTAGVNEFQAVSRVSENTTTTAPAVDGDTFSVGWQVGGANSYIAVGAANQPDGAVRLPRASAGVNSGVTVTAIGGNPIKLIDVITATDTVGIGEVDATGVRMTAGANYFEFPMTTAAGATAGASGAPPAQVAGYINVTINGTVRKIPFYAT